MLVQPILADYRVHFFNKLEKFYDVVLFCGRAEKSSGHEVSGKSLFKVIYTKIFFLKKGDIYIQFGLISGFVNFRPDVVFITGHPKNLSFWLLLVTAKFFKSKVLVHGQGFYNKPTPSVLIKLTYKLIMKLCDKYVCYTKSSLQSLSCLGSKYANKLTIADNTIYNPHSISERNIDTNCNGVLFVGRLREGSNFSDLADAIVNINSHRDVGSLIELHVVGTGTLYSYFYNKYSSFDFITFYGAIYEQNYVSDISRECFVGCYPGFAGLSVVHHFSLSLPTIVNADLESHMGPEPSYIENGVNGYLFSEYSVGSIQNTLEHVISVKNTEDYSVICKNAYQTYHKLITHDFSDKIVETIEGLF